MINYLHPQIHQGPNGGRIKLGLKNPSFYLMNFRFFDEFEHLPEESCMEFFLQICFSRSDFLVNSTTKPDIGKKNKIKLRSNIDAIFLQILKGLSID